MFAEQLFLFFFLNSDRNAFSITWYAIRCTFLIRVLVTFESILEINDTQFIDCTISTHWRVSSVPLAKRKTILTWTLLCRILSAKTNKQKSISDLLLCIVLIVIIDRRGTRSKKQSTLNFEKAYEMARDSMKSLTKPNYANTANKCRI